MFFFVNFVSFVCFCLGDICLFTSYTFIKQKVTITTTLLVLRCLILRRIAILIFVLLAFDLFCFKWRQSSSYSSCGPGGWLWSLGDGDDCCCWRWESPPGAVVLRRSFVVWLAAMLVTYRGVCTDVVVKLVVIVWLECVVVNGRTIVPTFDVVVFVGTFAQDVEVLVATSFLTVDAVVDDAEDDGTVCVDVGVVLVDDLTAAIKRLKAVNWDRAVLKRDADDVVEVVPVEKDGPIEKGASVENGPLETWAPDEVGATVEKDTLVVKDASDVNGPLVVGNASIVKGAPVKVTAPVIDGARVNDDWEATNLVAVRLLEVVEAAIDDVKPVPVDTVEETLDRKFPLTETAASLELGRTNQFVNAPEPVIAAETAAKAELTVTAELVVGLTIELAFIKFVPEVSVVKPVEFIRKLPSIGIDGDLVVVLITELVDVIGALVVDVDVGVPPPVPVTKFPPPVAAKPIRFCMGSPRRWAAVLRKRNCWNWACCNMIGNS